MKILDTLKKYKPYRIMHYGIFMALVLPISLWYSAWDTWHRLEDDYRDAWDEVLDTEIEWICQ